MELVLEAFALRHRQAGVRKHSDLIRDVVPRSRGFKLLELTAQRFAHLYDALGHLLKLGHPLRLQLRVAKALGDESGTLLRRRRVHWAHHQLHLREHSVSALLVRADEMQDADTLAVEAEVLREGLRQHELNPALLKESRGEVVLLEVAARIALVRVIQER